MVQMSDRELQSILDNSTAVIVVKDRSGRYQRINRRFEEIFGLDRSEVLGKTDYELFPREIADRFHANDLEVMQGAQPLQFEETAPHQGGTHHYLSVKFPLYDDAGVVYATAGIFTDITDRKRAEEKLRDSEQLFRSVFENAQIGISLYKVEGAQFFTNRWLHEMLGCTHEDLSSVAKWDLVVHPEERASGAERYAELLRGERDSEEWERRFLHRDGSVIIADARFTVIRNAGGKPQYVLNTTLDITKRKVAEELLRKREEELRHANLLAETALDLTKAGYWHVPLDGSGWFDSSPRRSKIVGDLPRSDGRYPLEEFFANAKQGDQAAAQKAEEAFDAAVAGKSATLDTVFAYKRPIDGQIVWIYALGHVVRGADSRPTDMYGVSQDITEFKRLEAQFVSAKEVAEAATRAKADFLANMSHEIRTPMNAILGMTHLALKTNLTAKQRDYLIKTKAAAQSLLGIVNDILDFSKIEAGKLDMEKADFRLEDVLANVSSVVGQRAHDKNLEFLIAAQQDLPAHLIGDALRLGQVLINLVNNAVKFTERGEIVVKVAVVENVCDQVNLKFSVRDSGIGMTAEQTTRLFHAFSQADSSTTRKYGGTGLGLSISKRLVEMMGGNIWVESQYGTGSTFHFTAWFGIGSAETKRGFSIPDVKGIRVLVVDDNRQARDILTESLKGFALRVQSVSSGEEAIRELVKADSQDPYQLVLTDWQMPGMDGLETIRIIKHGGRLKRIPKVVMVTAFGRDDICAQAEEIGIDGYVLKPTTPSSLYDTLVELFCAPCRGTDIRRVERADVGPYDATGIRILLVEDNEVNQQIATELLESVGADVRVASNGAEAVKMLTEGEQVPSFDVVFMDLQMPEMDGYATTRLLRTQPRFQRLPIIAMTAHALVEERERCLEAGMNDHLSKPIDPDALFVTLMRWTKPDQVNTSRTGAKPPKENNEMILPDIDGVDVASGLKRVAGNGRLYRDLLAQFATEQIDSASQIADVIEEGDRHLAERIAHTVKGVAGNLGLDGVFTIAAALELAIREGDSSVSALLEEFRRVLSSQAQAIQQAIHNFIPGEAEPQRSQEIDVRAAIARLRGLLETSDPDATEAFIPLQAAVARQCDKPQLAALGAAIRQFDFEGALAKLNDLSRKYDLEQAR
jgi:PAS domain S-box-containing protein